MQRFFILNPALLEVVPNLFIYLIVDVGRGKEKIKAITEMYNAAAASGKRLPKIIVVNGHRKESASKYKNQK